MGYYRGTHGVIVVYDVTSGESFANVKRWLHEIDQNCDVVNRILVGNKNDDPDRKVVLSEDARRFAQQMGIKLFETSARENINVEETFRAITQLVIKSRREQKARLENNGGGEGHGGGRRGQGNEPIRLNGRGRPSQRDDKKRRSNCCK